MSVYNGAAELPATVESILGQEGVDFEFIIVNDGSTDRSAEILSGYLQADGRIKVMTQENLGLTRALIAGCEAAAGQYIARQDCGDVSAPGRLSAQKNRLDAEAQLNMVGTGARSWADGELLFETRMTSDELSSGLSGEVTSKVFGPPHHGSVMFRKSAYANVGGYRPQFYFAQDLDLWLRLSEIGKVAMINEVFYEATLTPGAISGLYRAEQERLKSLALECRSARLAGESEQLLLETAAQIRKTDKRGDFSTAKAKGHYFIGSCLQDSAPEKARAHFRAALRLNPFHWRAAGQWCRSFYKARAL